MAQLIPEVLQRIFTLIPLSHLLYLASLYVLFLLVNRYFLRPAFAPYRNLPGPTRRESWGPIIGHLRPIIKGLPGEASGKWFERFGRVFQYEGIFGTPRLMVGDPTAISYILQHTEIFQKDDLTRTFLRRILGEGLLNVEGSDHRRQRKVMNPAFGPGLIRDHHLPIFYDKAYQLKEVLLGVIASSSSSGSGSETSMQGTRMDISKWLGKTTLDVIGLAGFGYDFNSLHDPTNELALAMERMFTATQNPSLLHFLTEFIPFGKYIPSKRKRYQKESADTTHRIGTALLEEKTAAVRAGEASLEKGKGKDLLSMVVRANMEPSLPLNARMSDAEVIATIQTFVLAGAETSSTALTWGSWVLAKMPQVQDALRKECEAVLEDEPSMDELNALPYLDGFVHEVLRLHSPVPQTRRDSISETVIPIGKPVRGKDGQMMDSIRVPKGMACMLAIINVNKSTEIWGPDALEFKPERWLNKEKSPVLEPVGGVWGNMFSFIAGPRACIGFRFSLIEIKCILFVLIRNFAFAEAVPTEDVIAKTAIVTRPTIRGEEKTGPQMPLYLRPLA